MGVSSSKRIEALLNSWPGKPALHRPSSELDEQSFTSIFDGGEPCRFERDLCSLDVSFIFPVDIRRHRFKTSEADQSENLPETVQLNYSLDTVIPG